MINKKFFLASLIIASAHPMHISAGDTIKNMGSILQTIGLVSLTTLVGGASYTLGNGVFNNHQSTILSLVSVGTVMSLVGTGMGGDLAPQDASQLGIVTTGISFFALMTGILGGISRK